MTQLKPITLCADDFGLNSGISLGIMKLIRKERLTAVSCLVNTPDFNTYANQLSSINEKIQIGLHFNLTEVEFLFHKKAFNLTKLLFNTHFGLLNAPSIAKEFEAQLNAFNQTLGFLPDFIDGHQHIHQLPGIREVILNYYEEHFKGSKTLIRSTYPVVSKLYPFKSTILALTGGKSLERQLTKLEIPHNPQFAGIYNFSHKVNYRVLFRKWLSMATPRTLIMCHPGEHPSPRDSIAAARQQEMSYLISDAFIEDCKELSCILQFSDKPNISRR